MRAYSARRSGSLMPKIAPMQAPLTMLSTDDGRAVRAGFTVRRCCDSAGYSHRTTSLWRRRRDMSTVCQQT